ncbi:MAG: branched-chain amino acid ABC transporter permease [Desulfovibrionaceae bacterium]
MIREYRRILFYFVVGLGWFYLLLFPFMAVKPEGIVLGPSLHVLGIVAVVAAVGLVGWSLKRHGWLNFILTPAAKVSGLVSRGYEATPGWAHLLLFIAVAVCAFFGDRYVLDVSINVMIYICLGLGLNIVVGLCGLLDLGYIAFYGVGAYVYALLAIHFGVSFWICLPISMALAALAGCIVGYPTLRMRGDYLAIVTLGFGEIVRLLLNNWMSLTNGPNGILGIPRPTIWIPSWAHGFTFESFYIKHLPYLYIIILCFTVFTIVAVFRLNYSRIGRAWEAMREDETAAELMGVNTFLLKLLAYAMGAVFGGLAGAYFSARMGSIFPTSFSFMESAMVLSMVVLGGMGSIPGVIVGALALVALPEVFRDVAEYRMFAFGAAMTLMMLFRPAGLIPAKRFAGRSEENI